MTDLESIAAAACPILDDVAVENDEVRFLQRFDCGPDDEPGDVAWDTLGRVRESLEEVGLTVEDSGSDNDSLWGRVVRVATNEMTTDEAAFLRAVIAEPDDDVPRLVFADHLDERGDPRGEFIRVQVELANLEANLDRGYGGRGVKGQGVNAIAALRRREGELLEAHGAAWAVPVVEALGIPVQVEVGGYHYHTYHAAVIVEDDDPRLVDFSRQVDYGWSRGFVSRLICSWADWSRHAAALLAAAPIRRVNRPRACGVCGGAGGEDHPGISFLCPACRGTGKVDDWRGDGRVVLTSMPAWEGPGPPDDDRLRLPGRDWHHVPFDNRDPLPPGQTRERIMLALLAAEWPGVRFELRAAGGEFRVTAAMAWDAIDQPTVRGDIRRGRESLLRDASCRAILTDTLAGPSAIPDPASASFRTTPEARP